MLVPFIYTRHNTQYCISIVRSLKVLNFRVCLYNYATNYKLCSKICNFRFEISFLGKLAGLYVT
jgi:hypothetical protein